MSPRESVKWKTRIIFKVYSAFLYPLGMFTEYYLQAEKGALVVYSTNESISLGN
jgi:hypothetical protein